MLLILPESSARLTASLCTLHEAPLACLITDWPRELCSDLSRQVCEPRATSATNHHQPPKYLRTSLLAVARYQVCPLCQPLSTSGSTKAVTKSQWTQSRRLSQIRAPLQWSVGRVSLSLQQAHVRANTALMPSCRSCYLVRWDRWISLQCATLRLACCYLCQGTLQSFNQIVENAIRLQYVHA